MICRYFLFLTLYVAFTQSLNAQNTDSLEKSIRDGTSDTIGVDLAVKHVRKLIRTRQLDKSYAFIELILKEARRLRYENGIIQVQSVRAAYYADKNEFEKSDSIYRQILSYAHQKNNKTALMNTFNSMGLNYYNHGDYELALQHHQQAARLAKALNDVSSSARYMSNMARIYNLYGDYENAIRYGKKAIDMERRKDGDIQAIVIRLINLSNYYLESGKFGEAITSCRDGIALNKSIHGAVIWEAYLRNNLGLSLLRSGQPEPCLPEFLFSRTTFSAIADSFVVAIIDANLAQAYSKLENWNQAAFFLQESNALARDETLDPESLRYRLEVSALLNEGKGDYRLALSDYKKSVQIRDSLYTQKQKEKIMSLREHYDSEVREDSIRHHREQAATERKLRVIDQQASRQKSIWLIISAVMVAALSTMAFLAYRNYRKKQQAHEILLRQKSIIEEKNKENELLLGEIHHRVKNNLQVISSLLSLQGKSISDENAKSAVEAGKLRVRSMELVHTLLYEGTHFSYIEMRAFTQRLIFNLCDVYGIDMKKIEINIVFPELRLDVDSAMPIALILNETIVNSFKHAYPKHPEHFSIAVNMIVANKELLLEVKDNGESVKREDLQQSGSFGFRLIELLTRQLRGSMEIITDNGFAYLFRFKEFKKINE